MSKYLLPLLLLPGYANAAVNITQVMDNLTAIIVPMMNAVLIISYVSGIFFILKSLLMLKKFGMNLNQNMSQPAELSGPLVYLIVGAFLVYLPSTTDMFLASFFGEEVNSPFTDGQIDLEALGMYNEIASDSADFDARFTKIVDTMILYIRFIGFISFIRGWFAIAHSGQPGVQPGTITKGIIHIISGIMAINCVELYTILIDETILQGT